MLEEVDREDDSIVHVESDFCEEEALRETLDEATPSLESAGFSSVQCWSKFGSLVFEHELP